MTFDDDECYRLLLATSYYIEDYEPATYGEADNLEKMRAVSARLREWYNVQRRAHGHSELT